MADKPDEASKTEEPTGKRLADARKKGQVPISREVPTWIMLFGSGIMMVTLLPGLLNGLTAVLENFISGAHEIPFTDLGFGKAMAGLLMQVLKYTGWLLAIFVILAVIGYIGQVGVPFSTESVKPKLSKINPLTGLKKYIGAKHYVEFGKGLLKMSIVGIVGVLLIVPALQTIDHLPLASVADQLKEMTFLILKFLAAALAVLFVIMIFDIVFQRYDHRKQLRMTRQEVKEEVKNQEGDPQIKRRLAQIRFQRAAQRMLQAVPNADVVVTNPTHFAVALAYKPDEMDAPRLVAKGQDFIAQKIREAAEEHDVTIVEDPPLARVLFATVEVDEEVPPEHYKAVAEVISFVWNAKKRKLPN